MLHTTLDYKIDMFASLDFAHAYQTCQKCALALSIITVAQNGCVAIDEDEKDIQVVHRYNDDTPLC